ncbi:flagellar biosynthesis anti-sigma factor FlgM [Ramlibacter sp. H39-3-26]|uniref:flagellar biosynthesis anti-sigma factor FlgM n=1 Tax=Curvibacter soli TaxID=3031331 RepID=UPI0023DA3E92|nr:flagellar biosynthesis anti-sigma factor FlgM [Ramlibacter sp. H39-3-26]MDF1485798.1 flagellar biosynthesis anti-sigma factor FlgM [Ramlibacter sp. H39-3-26]
MKIGPTPDPAASLTQAGTAKQTKQASTAAPAAPVKDASSAAAGLPVTVSVLARALDKNASPLDDIDSAKVDSVRTAISDGTFTVDAEAIAGKLLSNAQELLSRPPGH